MAPIATIEPSLERETDLPEKSFAASPSISEPIWVASDAIVALVGFDKVTVAVSLLSSKAVSYTHLTLPTNREM